ncbi:hypothetical protein L6164_016531 [Bauhinia variegata]|uniref:Uncharacterized protein n=1 Tax=Bauhinia variegata TaxID=167791 RepID=A0ACB9NNZ6_BAUVA|nr:hypothetical protein L6164_016531 [Bauhinia variegata]
MASKLSSTSALKLVLASMVTILLFSLGMSKQICPGPCYGDAACNAFCMSHGWTMGECVPVPPNVKYCCCAIR